MKKREMIWQLRRRWAAGLEISLQKFIFLFTSFGIPSQVMFIANNQGGRVGGPVLRWAIGAMQRRIPGDYSFVGA